MQHNNHDPAQPSQRRWALPLAVLVLAMVATIALLRFFAGGAAPIPRAFSPTSAGQTTSATLASAIAEATEKGKPVLVFATADWCPPCQHMKRTTLADESIAALIDERTIAYYLDVDASPREAAQLGVQGIPAFYIIDPTDTSTGRATPTVVSSTVGASDTSAFAEWLTNATKAIPKPR